MNNFNFGEVLTRAWQTIWKHKVLWIFGILASCARGNGGGGGGGGNSGYQTDSGNSPFPRDQFTQGLQQAGQYVQDHVWVIILFIILGILFFVVSYALGMMGRIGLIKGTYKSENGAVSLSFGEIWSESMPYFWRIFGLNFLVGLVFVVIFLPLVLGGVVTAGVGFLCALPLICILIPVSWVVSLVIEQAQPAVVIEDLSMLDALKRGWEIVKANLITMIALSLILGIGSAIVGLIIAIPIILAVVPVIIGAGSLNESLTPVYITLACCAVYMPVLIFFNGVLTAYIQSTWALTYMRLSKPKEDAPIFVEANA